MLFDEEFKLVVLVFKLYVVEKYLLVLFSRLVVVNFFGEDFKVVLLMFMIYVVEICVFFLFFNVILDFLDEVIDFENFLVNCGIVENIVVVVFDNGGGGGLYLMFNLLFL